MANGEPEYEVKESRVAWFNWWAMIFFIASIFRMKKIPTYLVSAQQETAPNPTTYVLVSLELLMIQLVIQLKECLVS